MLYRYDAVHAQLRRVQRLLLVDQFTGLLTNDARERLIEASDAHAPLSILAAASTAHLTAQLASLDVASGFVSRFVLVVAEQKTRLLGEPGARRPEAEARLAKFLENASYLQGPARFDSVRGELMRWGRSAADWISSHRGKSGLWESAAGLVSRMELTVRKLAVLVEITTSGSLDVSPASMNAAAALEHFTRSAFTRLMNEEIGRARQFNDELRLLGILRRNPGITRSRLQRSSHLDAETFRRALSALALAGSIRLDGPRISARGRNGNGIASAANVANAADFQLTAP